MCNVIAFKFLVVSMGLLMIWLISNKLIATFIPDCNLNSIKKDSYIIGKCENIIIYILILSDAFTSLAVIFAAKSLVRKDVIKKNSAFLVGTMLNFTISLTISVFVRFLLDHMDVF